MVIIWFNVWLADCWCKGCSYILFCSAALLWDLYHQCIPATCFGNRKKKIKWTDRFKSLGKNVFRFWGILLLPKKALLASSRISSPWFSNLLENQVKKNFPFSVSMSHSIQRTLWIEVCHCIPLRYQAISIKDGLHLLLAASLNSALRYLSYHCSNIQEFCQRIETEAYGQSLWLIRS